MAWSIDARLPIRFGTLDDAGEGDALLVEGDTAVPPRRPVARFQHDPSLHAAGCACCVPRSPAALALAGLFQARAVGDVPFFRRVLAVTRSAEAEMAVWAAVRADPLVSARFRLE